MSLEGNFPINTIRDGQIMTVCQGAVNWLEICFNNLVFETETTEFSTRISNQIIHSP